MVASGDGVKKVEGLRNTKWQLQNSCGDVTYSIGNVVNDIVIAMHDANGYWKYQGEHFVKYMVV